MAWCACPHTAPQSSLRCASCAARAELRQNLRSVRRREAQVLEQRQRGAQHGPEPTVELLKLWCVFDLDSQIYASHLACHVPCKAWQRTELAAHFLNRTLHNTSVGIPGARCMLTSMPAHASQAVVSFSHAARFSCRYRGASFACDTCALRSVQMIRRAVHSYGCDELT